MASHGWKLVLAVGWVSLSVRLLIVKAASLGFLTWWPWVLRAQEWMLQDFSRARLKSCQNIPLVAFFWSKHLKSLRRFLARRKRSHLLTGGSAKPHCTELFIH